MGPPEEDRNPSAAGRETGATPTRTWRRGRDAWRASRKGVFGPPASRCAPVRALLSGWGDTAESICQWQQPPSSNNSPNWAIERAKVPSEDPPARGRQTDTATARAKQRQRAGSGTPQPAAHHDNRKQAGAGTTSPSTTPAGHDLETASPHSPADARIVPRRALGSGPPPVARLRAGMLSIHFVHARTRSLRELRGLKRICVTTIPRRQRASWRCGLRKGSAPRLNTID